MKLLIRGSQKHFGQLAASIASAEFEFQANKLEDEFGAFPKDPYKFSKQSC